MTISSVGGSGAFAQPSLALDAEGQLALLLLENEQTNHQRAAADKALAREQYVEASNREVEAMRAEASHILVGAVAQGAFTVASAAVQVGDVLDDPGVGSDGKPLYEKPWGEIGAASLNGSGPMLGKFLGDSPAASDRADARQAASAAQQATWRLDDAQEALGKAEARSDKVLDWLTSESANEASTETGILAGFA